MISRLSVCWGLTLLFSFAAAGFGARGRMRAAILLAGAALATHAALYWPFTVDDAYITFRYARSWIEGLGPIFQAGEHVEGVTSFGWLGLIALAGRLGADLETSSKVLGLVSAAAALPAAHAIASRLTGRPRLGLAAALMLALSPLYAAWAVAGMDAPLFAAVIAWAVWARIEGRTLGGAIPLEAVLLGLSVCIRPEGFLFAGIAWLAHVAEPEPRRWGRAVRWALTAAAIAVPFWLWRWSYYGGFLPNTFYAKLPNLTLRLTAGLTALRDLFRELEPWVWIPVLISVAGAVRARGSHRLPWILVGVFAIYVEWSGGDVLHLRFFIHVMPLLAVVWAVGVGLLLDGLARLRVHPPPAVRAALAAGLIAAWGLLAARRDARAFSTTAQVGPGYVVNNARNTQEVALPLGAWLATNVPSGYELATWDIGGIGYVSRLPILDLYGLTDAPIARMIHDQAPAEQRIAYFFRANPELIVTYARVKGPEWGWLAPAADSVMAHYHYHSLWQARSSGYWLVLIARDDIALPPPPPEVQARRGPPPDGTAPGPAGGAP